MRMMRFVSILIFVLAACGAQAVEIRFATESYPPYSYQAADGTVEGAGVAQVRAIMDGLKDKVPYKIEILPWARAIARAEAQEGNCVFAAARTRERENRFTWVTPLLMDINLLVARTDDTVKATSIEEAQQISVGTHREDFTQELLKEKGFTRIDLSPSFGLTLAKLLAGRIDLMPMSDAVFYKLVGEGKPIRSIAALSQQQLGIACNRQMPPGLIEEMQASLDRLRATGEQNRIQARFSLPSVP